MPDMTTENKDWLVARKLNECDLSGYRVRCMLERLGFAILGQLDTSYYVVHPPVGWTQTNAGFWTSFYDPSGAERFAQFCQTTGHGNLSRLEFVTVK